MLSTSADQIAFVFGAFVVLIFCIRYFNEPQYPLIEIDKGNTDDIITDLQSVFPKYMTDRYHYNLYLVLFVIATEILYLLLCIYFPSFSTDTANKPSADAVKNSSFGYNALLSALIIAGFLPNLPFIKSLLESIKKFLHTKAEIPSKGQEIYQILKNRQIQYSKNKIAQIIREPLWTHSNPTNESISKKLLEEGDFLDVERSDIKGKLAKLTYFLYQITKWSEKTPFKKCVCDCELKWNSIKTSYEAIKDTIYLYDTNSLNELQKSELNTKLDVLLLRTYRLLSCLLFIADKNSCSINDNMEELGYNVKEPPIFSIPFNQLALSSLSIGVGIFLAAFLTLIISVAFKYMDIFNYMNIKFIGMIDEYINTGNLIRWMLQGIPFLTAPVLFVLLVKRHLSFKEDIWPLVTPRNDFYKRMRDRPWGTYFLVSVGAYIASFLTLATVNAVVKLFNEQSSYINFEKLGSLMIWSLVGAITAAFVAYRIDSRKNFSENRLSKTLLTFSGAIFQALITSSSIYFVFMHRHNNGSFVFMTLSTENQAKLSVYLIMGFLIGAGLFLNCQFNTDQYERRKHKRSLTENEIKITAGNQSLKGSILNISKGGCLIKSSLLAKNVGDVISINIKDNYNIEAEILEVNKESFRVRYNNECQLVT